LPGRLTCPAKFYENFSLYPQNQKKNYYIGITKLKPELRLLRYNKGDVKSTKYKRP